MTRSPLSEQKAINIAYRDCVSRQPSPTPFKHSRTFRSPIPYPSTFATIALPIDPPKLFNG
ncbi:hypothetical protein B9Z19DRAFT_1070327 [Tuber borchii]|uniref:Uncharacterized protein n=1 Tax=Tuber borchii TaxID=42251 RepID=A0A2T7A9L3_TUBBO|nr:hypothetical protein B9Z19DRAFT_1070327 [Tuber borchii]